jgi:hypothetical protein
MVLLMEIERGLRWGAASCTLQSARDEEPDWAIGSDRHLRLALTVRLANCRLMAGLEGVITFSSAGRRGLCSDVDSL